MQRIEGLGLGNDAKFEPRVKRVLEGLDGEASQFENGQIELGNLLGYDAAKLQVEGAPDPYWRVDKSLVIVFEDHSDGSPKGTLSIDKARQAAGHEKTIRKHLELDDRADVITVLVSPVARAAEEALQHLESVYFVSLDDYKAWAYRALEVIREIRATMGRDVDFESRQQVLESLVRAVLAPTSLVDFFTSNSAVDSLK